jgi:nitrate/nitrite transport system permease protein
MQMLINRVNPYLALLGLGWLVPILKIASGDNLAQQLRDLWQQLGVPLLAIALFLAVWAGLAARIDTSLGGVPGPAAVWHEAQNLVAEHRAERERRAEFYARQEARNAAALAENPAAETRVRRYTGKPTYLDQILTSLATVFTGFVLGTLVAVPLGVLAGLSKTVNAAINPLVQIFNPVSPLAWLPS